MGLSVSGLGSGLDWKSILSQLRQVEVQQKINPLTNRQNTYESKLSAWDSMGTKLSSLLTAVGKIKDTADYEVFSPKLTSSSTSLSADSVLSATVDSTAGKGSYDIKVTNLAVAEKVQSKTVADQENPAWTGTLTIEGEDVVLDGTESLQEIRDLINEKDAGVTASILKVADTDYRLILTKEDEGETLAITDPNDYFVDTPLQAQESATFTVDGISFTRTSNTVTDVIPGLTLKLTGETGTTNSIKLNVDRDQESIKSNIQSFVDSYNEVIGYINGQMTYNESSKTTGGALFGDITLKSIKSNLQNTVLSAGLSGLGVTFDSNGKLSLDSDDLQSALDTDFNGAATAFSGVAQSLDTILNNLTDSIDGTVTMQKESIQDSIDWLTKKIDKTQTSIDQKMASLQTQFINMDAALNQLQSQSSWLSSVFSSS